MAQVTVKGMNCTGHGCFPPRPSTQGAGGFTIGGIGVVLVGHAYAPHACPDTPPHGGTLASGASGFTVGGKQIGRIGDPVSCGSSVGEGVSGFTIG